MMKKFFSVFLLVFLFTAGFGQTMLNDSTDLLANEVHVASGDVLTPTPGTLLEDSIHSLYLALNLEKHGLKYTVFHYGMIGYLTLRTEGKLSDKPLFSIIDFSQSSRKKRFYTIDLAQGKVVFNTLVSHGKNTGEDMATSFSDRVHSNQSSLGFYITGEIYTGSKGYSLRLDGMEEGFNGNMRERAVVMHEAAYVSQEWVQKYGRLGRSQGCPALPVDISRHVIDMIKERTAIFAFYNDPYYLRTSTYLNSGAVLSNLHALGFKDNSYKIR